MSGKRQSGPGGVAYHGAFIDGSSDWRLFLCGRYNRAFRLPKARKLPHLVQLRDHFGFAIRDCRDRAWSHHPADRWRLRPIHRQRAHIRRHSSRRLNVNHGAPIGVHCCGARRGPGGRPRERLLCALLPDELAHRDDGRRKLYPWIDAVAGRPANDQWRLRIARRRRDRIGSSASRSDSTMP